MSEENQDTAPKMTFKVLDEDQNTFGRLNTPVAGADDRPEPAPPAPEDVKPDVPELVIPDPVPATEYDDDKVLSYFKSKGREVESLEDLFKEQTPQVIEKDPELPDQVSAYLKYYNETGRSPKDWVELNRDYHTMDADEVLALYISKENPEWSMDEVRAEMAFRYGYDPDDVEETEKNRIDRNKKSDTAKAINHLNELKEKYAAPLASREFSVPDEDKEILEEFKQYKASIQESEAYEQEARQHFSNKTAELFSADFKGFDFKVADDKTLTYKPDSPENLMKAQSNTLAFMQSFLDDKGLLKDPAQFHRAIAIARDPDSFAKHFYELGVADKVLADDKEAKNINMDRRPDTSTTKKAGMTFKVLDDDNTPQYGRIVPKSGA